MASVGVTRTVLTHMVLISAPVKMDTTYMKMEKLVLVIDFEINFFLFINSNSGFLHADINECATNNGRCSQLCLNTEGSYICDCYPGYEFGSNNHTCSGRSTTFLKHFKCISKHAVTLPYSFNFSF